MRTVLGNSGLAVRRMGLGLAAPGRPAYINVWHASDLAGHTPVASLERLTHSVLDAAYGGLLERSALIRIRRVVLGSIAGASSKVAFIYRPRLAVL